LLRLVLVAPETSEAHGAAEFERLCLLLARNASARPKYDSAFAAKAWRRADLKEAKGLLEELA
jgi:hypothetical protein